MLYSYDVNGTYRHFFEKENWKYSGLDVEAGPNVDIVASLYEWNIKEAVRKWAKQYKI